MRSHPPIEAWLIDEKNAALCRAISVEEDECLPILKNHEMARFRCVDESVLREWMP